MALNPSNSSNLEHLASKGLMRHQSLSADNGGLMFFKNNSYRIITILSIIIIITCLLAHSAFIRTNQHSILP